MTGEDTSRPGIRRANHPGVKPGSARPPQGRYEVRDHPTIKGLVEVYWIDAAAPIRSGLGKPVVTLGSGAVTLLFEGLGRYLDRIPVEVGVEGDPS